jgi:hypothetical protein
MVLPESRANPYPTPESSRSTRYAPYKSIIASLDDKTPSTAQPSQKPNRPPWRRKVGEVWFTLNSEYGLKWGEHITGGEVDDYEEIVSRMFKNVSDKEDWNIPIEDDYQDVGEMSLDTDREWGGIGAASVMYTRDEVSACPTKSRSQ